MHRRDAFDRLRGVSCIGRRLAPSRGDLSLGLKAGERIWVPPWDQARLQKLYDFDKCDDLVKCWAERLT
jgi:hypothetical protein